MMNGLPRHLLPIQVGLGIVVIRPYRQRDAPERHGALRIDLRRSLEGTKRLVMIEGVNQREPLIEKSLGFRLLGGDRMVHVAQAGHEDSGRAGGG